MRDTSEEGVGVSGDGRYSLGLILPALDPKQQAKGRALGRLWILSPAALPQQALAEP